MDGERVVILHSNDIHSRLENAAKIATIIEEERNKQGADGLLVLDIGDHMDRTRLETEGSDGKVNAELLAAAGYEAIALGNNEGLTYSRDELVEAYRDASFAILGANMPERYTGKLPSWMKPHAVIEKRGLRIGLIAVTAAFTDFYSLLGWDLTDPIEAVRQEVQLLRDQVDVIAVLSHLGLSFDKRMAEEINGIDLIMGGHTHHLLEEPLVIGNTTICAAGKFGEYVGRIELQMNAEGCQVIRAEVIATAAYEEQSEALAIIRRYRESGIRRLNRVIARLEEPLPASAEQESPLANLLAAGLRRHTDAEIGIVNTGQLLGGLPRGDVTERQLHALCPSPINPCRMQLTGKHIREALEQALLPEYTAMPIKGYGFRGEVLGTLALDGMRVEYDKGRSPMARILSATVNGEPLDDERSYVAGCIDMFTFRTGYLSLAEGREITYYLPEFIRDVIAAELTDAAAIRESYRDRWQSLSNF
ncbi:bifunctional metallophosphatase/5'-nucleotidase [Paenibacillus sp. NPDC058071]|uniref:bifunctional metallophosphatase/5'-nucleotidase n=1 Tax=Paenibacillus sp. NPDC058071 TaxID=3346326 RepID=UPI0036DC787F